MANSTIAQNFELRESYFQARPFVHPISIPNFEARDLRAEARLSLKNLFIIIRDTDRHPEIFEFMMNFPMGDLLMAHYRRLPLLQNPAFLALYRAKSLPDFTTDGAKKMLALPPDTLGHAYGQYVLSRGLTDDFLSYLEAPTDPMRYFVFRMVLLHDLVHFLLDFEPGIAADEMAVEVFLFSQNQAWNHLFFLQGYLLNLLTQRPEAFANLMPRLRLARQLGQRWPNLCLIPWQEHLHRPLSQVRAELGLNRMI